MNEDFYITLIYKQLNEAVSPEELSQLSSWENASEENKLTARSVRVAWEASGQIKNTPKIDLDAQFDQLQKALQLQEASPQVTSLPKRKNSRRFYLRIAAAILLLPVLYFTLNNLFYSNGPKWVEVTTSDGEQETITLMDGSMVTLSENSTLSYPGTFSESERRLSLTGKAFFEVNAEADRPFIVSGSTIQVEVLGTAFSVSDGSMGSATEVMVQEGKVAVSTKTTEQEIILQANESVIYQESSEVLEKTEDWNPNDLAWYTRRLTFSETPVEEVIKVLADYYRIEIRMEDTSLSSCTFDSTFDDEPLEIIITSLETVYGIEVNQLNERTYVFKGGSCQ